MPIRLGIIGLGNVAVGHHLPTLAAMSELVRVVAVADPSPERRQLAIDLLGLDRAAAVESGDQLLARTDLDAVDLATPPSLRTNLALQAIDRRLAVLCEKPIATTPADGHAIAAAAESSGVPVGIVHNYLELPEIVAARAIVDEGAIGAPEVAILNYLGVEDRPGSGAWRPSWRHEAAVAGGGVLMDMLHVVYVAETLLATTFRRVSAEVFARSPGAQVEDVALCRFETDEAAAVVNVGWGVGPGGISVTGRLGRIDIGYAGGGTGPFAPLVSVRLTRRDGRVEDRTPAVIAEPGRIDVHFEQTLRSFFERVAAGQRPAATAADGVRVLEATLGAYASAVEGRTVDLPLSADSPVRARGIAGLAELQLSAGGSIARRGVFGVGGPLPT
jgi:UDP-N-acetyl-2-amino-2-deoxyglucuronate dehydrogenase